MLGSDVIYLEIPSSLPLPSLMESLAIGHGYQWTVLVKTPKFVAWGKTSMGPETEVLIIGRQMVLQSQPAMGERMKHLIKVLARRRKQR